MRRKIKYTKVSSIYIKDMKPLDSVLLQALKSLGVEEKMTEKMIIKFWKEMFGTSIINATNNIVYNNRSLTIYMNSSVIKSELLMLRTEILHKFQTQFGKDNIIFLNIY